MPSSFPKHHCLHRLITFFTALLLVGSFILLLNKQRECKFVPIADELWSSMVNNQSLQYEYIEQYYDDVQIYHISLISIDVIIFLVAFINIAPAQEDLRFGFHLLLIITLSGLTILACYTSYVVFYKPCHPEPPPGIVKTDDKQVYLQSSKTNAGKNAPINAYVEYDLHIIAVAGMDALACLMLLISTMVLCGDAREEAIQDEYVARVRASIY